MAARSASAAIVVAITLMTLVLAELVPRRIALVRPERIARMFSRPVRALATVAVPVVGILSAADRSGDAFAGHSPQARAAGHAGRDLSSCSAKGPRRAFSRKASTR